MDQETPTELLPDAHGRRFGWIPPPPDQRHDLQDFHTLQLAPNLAVLLEVDLRRFFPPVYNQGRYNACTPNAVAGIIDYLRSRQGLPAVPPSRLFIYWYERLSTGHQNADAGGSVAAAIHAAVTSGYCLEQFWPYIDAAVLVPPGGPAVADSARRRAISPVPLVNFNQIKVALSNGQPVAFGLRIYNSFFQGDLNHGIVPMPVISEPNERHAAVLVGYSDASQQFIMRNSWGLVRDDGVPCGDAGHYYLPYAYLDPRLCEDFWTIASVADHP